MNLLSLKTMRAQPDNAKAVLAREALSAIERVYLRACGWKYIGDDWWQPPSDYVFNHKHPVPHRLGHAVNSQKLADSYR